MNDEEKGGHNRSDSEVEMRNNGGTSTMLYPDKTNNSQSVLPVETDVDNALTNKGGK